MTTHTRSIAIFLLAIGGLLVWAMYFSLAYFAQSAFCTLTEPGWQEHSLRVIELIMIALAAVGIFGIAIVGRVLSAGGDGGRNNPDLSGFLRRIATASAGLSLLAVAWMLLPVLLLSPC